MEVAADLDKLGGNEDMCRLVTYEVKGMEDGPLVNRFEIRGDGNYSSPTT